LWSKNLQIFIISKIKYPAQKSISFPLSDTLDHKHPLYVLGHKIRWSHFEGEFTKLYREDNGRPGKPLRFISAILILKHLRNISDEGIVEQWSENVNCQHSFGMEEFHSGPPCASSEPVHFRKRTGASGINYPQWQLSTSKG
jgi:IS5 family transposase